MEILNRKNSIVEMSMGITSSMPTSPSQKQHRFTDVQKDLLLRFYDNTAHYPTPEEYTEFARRFGISNRRAKIWFKNRRLRDKKRSRSQPVRTKSEPWNQESIYKRPPLPQLRIWEIWGSEARAQTTQIANKVLCKNPHTFQIQFCQQQLPTYQGQGFIPSDLYEAQAWLKKKREWNTYWENIIKINTTTTNNK